MFSPKRSTERKVDRKTKRERFRRMSDSRDNNIKLNLLGVPKEQVLVKKTHQESNNEDLFKIYIDTKNNADKKNKLESPVVDKYGNKRKQGYNSVGSTGDSDKPKVLGGTDTESSDPTKTRPNSDVCLTLGEKKKSIKIVQRPSETNFRGPLNEQYNMQDNVHPESRVNQLFQLSKEQIKRPQSGRLSSPDRDMQRNTENIRRSSVDRRLKKQGPKQVGFSDYDAVYGTGSEESLSYSGDDLPFDRRSPMVYQVGGTLPESGFGGTSLQPSPDLTTTDGDKRSVTHPADQYNESPELSKSHDDQKGQPTQLEFTPSPMTEQLANLLMMDDNLTPQTHRKLKEQPSLRDNIEQSSLNVIGERHPEMRPRNATRPMTVDKQVMTDRSSVTNKGNISNLGSSLFKQLPVSTNSSKESTDSNRSSDLSKPRKSIVSSIPKPDFGIFRRPKTPKSTKEHGNDPEVHYKTSKDKNEDDIEQQNKETAVNVTYKTPRKLTPINVNERNYKPLFFPADTNDDFENRNKPSQPWSRNVTDGQLKNKASKPGQSEKQTSADPDIKKLDGDSQSRDKTMFPQDTASVGKSDEISHKTYTSRAVSDDLNKNRDGDLIPVDDNVALLPKFNLNEAGPPRFSRSSSYGTPRQPRSDANDKQPTRVIDTRGERVTFDDRQSDEKQYHEPRSPVFDGYADLTDEEPSYGVPDSQYDMYGAPVEEHIDKTTANSLHSTRPESLEPFKHHDDQDVKTKQLDFTPSPMTEELANLLMMDGNFTPQTHRKLKEQPSLKDVKEPTSKSEPTSSTSFQDPAHGSNEIIAHKTHGGVNEIGGLSSLSGLHPNDYASTGAIPRTTSAAKSSKGSLKSGQVWPSVGERLSKRGSPCIETIQEEDADETGRPLLGLGNKMNQTYGNAIKLPENDSEGVTDPDDAFGEGNNYIDKNRTNIIAFPGHLSDGTPFAYTPSGPGAYPLDYTHHDGTQHNQPTPEHDDGIPFAYIPSGSGAYPLDYTHPDGAQHNQPIPEHDDGIPFAYIPSGSGAYPLDYTHPDGAQHKQPIPEHDDSIPFAYIPSGPGAYPLDYTHPDGTQLKQPATDHDDVTRRLGRMSKASRKRPVPSRMRKQSGMPRGHDLDDQTGNDGSAFGQGPQQEIIYLGKIPNTTYNVFYSPDEVKEPRNIESKTVVPVKSEKMISDGPKGILIFVNKKNDHKCPFTTNGYGDKSMNPDENKSTNANKYDDHHASPIDYGYVQPREGSAESRRGRDPNKDKKVTVKRTSRGKNVTEEFPCGCYRTTTFDLGDELQTEAFISALCTEGSFCEVAHPELAKHKENAYRSNESVPFRPKDTDHFTAKEIERPRDAITIKDATKRKRPSYEYGGAFPGIEVIADGVLSNKEIKPRTPGQKMKGGDLLASFNIKSNKLSGVCNLYLDPRLKRYLRENLSTILADDEKMRSKRQSY